MARYIDADRLEASVLNAIHSRKAVSSGEILQIINQQPAVEVHATRRGIWVKNEFIDDHCEVSYDFICSECGEHEDDDKGYCSNCGAKMDGLQE